MNNMSTPVTVEMRRWEVNFATGKATLDGGRVSNGRTYKRTIPTDPVRGRVWEFNEEMGEGSAPQPVKKGQYVMNDYTNYTHGDNRNGCRTRLAGWCWGQWGRHPVLGVLGVVGGLAYLVKLLFDVLGGVIGGLLGSVSFGWLGGLVSVTGFLILVIAGLVGFIIWDRRHPSQRRR